MVASSPDLAEIAELAWMPRVEDPRVFGRDSSNPYYDFLYRLVDHLQAERVLELGTCEGGSTSYLAAARAEAKVVSVDIAPREEAAQRLRSFPNVRLVKGNTLDPMIASDVGVGGPFDVMFIDTVHEYEHVSQELELYRPYVKTGGVIVIDDIRANEGMMRFWRELSIPKRELNHLHRTGFGVCLVPVDASSGAAS